MLSLLFFIFFNYVKGYSILLVLVSRPCLAFFFKKGHGEDVHAEVSKRVKRPT